MKSICFNPKTASILTVARTSLPSTPSTATTTHRPESTLTKIIAAAESIITKWDPDSSAYTRITSLFFTDKTEAMEFINCVNDLQKVMNLLMSDSSASAGDNSVQKLHRLQSLKQIAMKRLQKEFSHILTLNRAQLDPESVSTGSSGYSFDEILFEGESSVVEDHNVTTTVMADLRSVAECMIASGYAKECANIYVKIRKSIIEEGVLQLGVEKLTASRVNKMDWEVLEVKIKIWLEAVKISMRTTISGERILCDHVFAASTDSVRESCFGAISRDGAMILFGFPEIVAAGKKSFQKLFRFLDMYASISENWSEIKSIFAFDSTSDVRSQALSSLARLGESIRDILSNFETTIRNDSSKSPVRDGGIHPLTIFALDYLSMFADYSQIVADVFLKWPPPASPLLPESYFSNPNSGDAPASTVSLHTAWLLLVLLCKLDGKADQYTDNKSLSYLFLANNLQYIVRKVRGSNLQYLLGEDWIVAHENKVRHYAASYERLAWSKVYEALPENLQLTQAEVEECFLKFNSSFEEAYRRQSSNVVEDSELRDEIRLSIERKLVAQGYKLLYDGRERNAAFYVKYAPEDIQNYLSDLFPGSGDQECPDHGRKTRTSPLSPSSPWRRLVMFRRCHSNQ